MPGHERETRSRKVVSAKVWIMSFACPVTKLVNLQVIESKSADGILEGLTRMACEHGFPSYLILDQDKSFMKAVNEAEIDLKDLMSRSYKEKGVKCEVAPVSGHNFTGLIERKIKTVQGVFDTIGLKSMRLHATGLQTLSKLVECQLNDLPLGFSYDRAANTTPLLKLITPNLMKLGRLHSRALNGPVRFPRGPKDIMEKVEKTFDAFFKIWNVSLVPKLIPQPKWFVGSQELRCEDVVYFQKTESELSSAWTVGQVDSVTRSRDGVVRRVIIRYYNHGENQARFTDRAVQSLVCLFNVEDNYFLKDMAEVEMYIKNLMQKQKPIETVDKKVTPIKLKRTGDKEYETVASSISCGCCCIGHCRWNDHKYGYLAGVSMSRKVLPFEHDRVKFQHVYDKNLFEEDFDEQPIRSSLTVDTKDEIYNVLTALETKFDLEENF